MESSGLNMIIIASFLCLTCCGTDSAESLDPGDDGASQDLGSGLLAEHSNVRTPPYARAADGFAEVNAKRAALPAQIRSDYYDHSIREISATPDGTRFQFFAGARGMGAIYRIHGTLAIYGPFLSTWADQGYELSWLGYPTADASTTPPYVQPFLVDQSAPDPSNGGLLRAHRLLRWDGQSARAYYDEADEYLVSGYPDSTSPNPQACQYYPYAYAIGTAQAELYPGEFQKLWCGGTPPGSYQGSSDVDPSNI